MTDGAYSSYPSKAFSLLNGIWSYRNFGLSGQTTIEMLADGEAQINPLYDAALGKNVVVFWEVTNDLKPGATRADAQARMVSYCQARQAAGFKVVVGTILPRTQVGLPETFEDDRIAINTYIRANYASFADVVADVASDARIGDFGDSDDTTYFSDGVHMTTAGYNIVGGIVATAINSL
jgi:lysophospholipase L1-like esterase